MCIRDRRADAVFMAKLHQLAIASDFALATFAAQSDLIERLHADGGRAPSPSPVLDESNRADWPRLLRRYRQAESTRLVWRDVLEGDPVDAVLAGSTCLLYTSRCV